MEENKTYDGIKDGIRESMQFDINQQSIEIGFAWIHNAIKEGTKEAITEAINNGKIKI
jgi:hypothetical protein